MNLLPAPSSAADDALAVVRALRAAGFIAFFAGGCVRDLLLQLDPKDYDIATDAPPTAVRGLFRRTQAVGQAFGVILVRQGTSVIEVATFRSDGAYTDGRRPDAVRFTTAEEDARRRDFTINGLFFDPIDQKVIDYVGGQADLSAKVIRAIGVADQRFGEDFLRLLRAVRFAARLGFTIEPATFAAVTRHAKSLKQISPERITDELRRMLTPVTRPTARRLLQLAGLEAVIFRHVPDRAGSDVFTRLAPDVPISFGLALAGLLVDPTSPPTAGQIRQWVQAMRQSLKISNDEAADLAGSLTFGHLLNNPTVAMQKRFLASPWSDNARRLLRAMGEEGPLAEPINLLRSRLIESAKGEIAPTPWVNGDDLVAAGLAPGRAFKRILDAVYDAQLEGRLADQSAAMRLALDLARASGDQTRPGAGTDSQRGSTPSD